MVEVFLKILNMSITATYVLIAVLILRLLLKRAPKRISYMLWSVLLFRLVCPVSISSAFSLFNFFNAPVADSGGIEYISKGNGLTVVPQISSDAGYFGKTVSPVVTQAAETTDRNCHFGIFAVLGQNSVFSPNYDFLQPEQLIQSQLKKPRRCRPPAGF